MRKKVYLFSLAIILAMTATVSAQEPSKSFTRESLLAHYRYTYSPKETFDYIQQAALWLSKQGETGLDEFGAPFTKWNTLDGYHLQVQVWSIEEGEILRHPNPKLQHIVGVPKLINHHKDHSGRLASLEQMNKMKRSPKGAWTVTYTTYEKSVTGVADPFYVLNLGIKVPGYPWYIITHLPYQTESNEEAQKAVDDLNGLVDEWSIIP